MRTRRAAWRRKVRDLASAFGSVRREGLPLEWQAPRTGGNQSGPWQFVRPGKSALMGESMLASAQTSFLNLSKKSMNAENFSALRLQVE
jgi:hypothetical protein